MDGLSGLRPLRDLPAAVPDVPRARRGDGLAARPHLPHARGRRGPHSSSTPTLRAAPRSAASAAAPARRRARRACSSASSSRRRGARSSGRACARPTRIIARCSFALSVFPHPGRLGAACSARCGCYQRSGSKRLVRALGLLGALPSASRSMEALLPRGPRPDGAAARGHARARHAPRPRRASSPAASSGSSIPT